MEFSHIPVLLGEVIEGLAVKPGGIYIDCTTGGGGHSRAIAARLGAGRLVCFDQDKEAIAAAKENLAGFENAQISFINDNFSGMDTYAGQFFPEGADGILMDLGVSSYQLDNPARGFSFHEDAPLDMRMSGEGTSAYDVVNFYEKAELLRILYRYGEEKYAKGIVGGILRAREASPISTTGELAEIIKRSVPLKVRREKNPCRKTFQAIRIEVNDELGVLEKGLESAFDRLRPGGRLAVISFHSLEDRIVKNAFRQYATGCVCPPDFPICTCGRTPRGALVGRKPVTAGEDELRQNPRSRSAKLRVIEKL